MDLGTDGQHGPDGDGRVSGRGDHVTARPVSGKEVEPRPARRREPRRRRGTRGLPFAGARLLRFPSRSRAPSSVERVSPAEDELYLAIGRVAANWSLVELVSGLVLMGLVGSRDETLARAVVAGQRVENVWETIDALLVAYGDPVAEQRSEFGSWRRTANALRRRRNEAIHSAWSLTDSGGRAAAWDMMSQRAKRGARPDLFPGGVADLEELARDIAALEARLTAIHETVFLAPEVSRPG